MPYTTNMMIFSAAGTQTTHGVLGACYCKLVTIELALKTATGIPNGHDIPNLLTAAAASKTTKIIGDANNLSASLVSDLNNIMVTGTSGNVTSARGKAYPDIRYTRLHVDPWPNPRTTEATLIALNATIDSIRAFITNDLGIIL